MTSLHVICGWPPPIKNPGFAYAYIPISRHIRKGVLIRRITASRLCAELQLVTNNFAKNRENGKGELCLNVIIPFSIIVCCLVVT